MKKCSKPTITECNASDVHRSGNALSEFRGNINDHLNFVSEMRKELFGQELALKDWKANELLFYDDIINDLTAKKGILEGLVNSVNHTYITLRRRFHPQAASNSEQKRSMKRKEDNKAENKREKRRRLTKSDRELVHKMIKNKSSIQDDKSCQILRSGYRIKLSDTCNNFEPAELTPRFHLIPLCHLLHSNLFENSAMTWAQEIQRDLEEKAKKASEANDNMKKKEK